MDLYNTLWWAGDDRRYIGWGSIYPPINFLFLDALKAAFYGEADIADSLTMRDISILPALVVCALHLVAPAFVVFSNAWKEILLSGKWCILTFTLLSSPLLFSMERGNLIIIALFFLAFVFNPSAVGRVIAVAILINIKPYFAFLLIGFLFSRRWDRFLASTCLAGAIFLFSGLLTDLNFPIFILNLVSYSQNETVLSGREVLAFPSSVSAFSYVINLAIKNSAQLAFPSDLYLGAASLVEAAKLSTIAVVLAMLAFKGRRITEERIMAILIIVIVNLGIWVGGYSQIFYLACLPALFQSRFKSLFLLGFTVIALPLDMLVLQAENLGPVFSFASSTIVDLQWQLGAGTFLRPAINFILMLLCIADLIYLSPVMHSHRSSEGNLI